MTPSERDVLAECARTAAEDVAEYRTPGGTMVTWDDRRVGRMLAREPNFARLVPLALAEVDRRATRNGELEMQLARQVEQIERNVADLAALRRLIADARARLGADSTESLAERAVRVVLELAGKQERIEELEVRQQELLATIVRVTNETPFPDEIEGWTDQRAKLVAEIGTLRARVAELGGAA